MSSWVPPPMSIKQAFAEENAVTDLKKLNKKILN
jgi:hypothetical protein